MTQVAYEGLIKIWNSVKIHTPLTLTSVIWNKNNVKKKIYLRPRPPMTFIPLFFPAIFCYIFSVFLICFINSSSSLYRVVSLDTQPSIRANRKRFRKNLDKRRGNKIVRTGTRMSGDGQTTTKKAFLIVTDTVHVISYGNYSPLSVSFSEVNIHVYVSMKL